MTSGKDGRKDKKKCGFSIRSLSPFRRCDSKKESDKKALKSAQDEWRRSLSGLQWGLKDRTVVLAEVARPALSWKRKRQKKHKSLLWLLPLAMIVP